MSKPPLRMKASLRSCSSSPLVPATSNLSSYLSKYRLSDRNPVIRWSDSVTTRVDEFSRWVITVVCIYTWKVTNTASD